MQNSNQEIIFVIIIGGVIGLLLVGFIITILYFYQQRQHKQEKEILNIKEQYEKEFLNSQLEIQEDTMKQIGEELHDNIKQQLLVVSMALRFLPIDSDDPMFETIHESKNEINKVIEDIAQLSHSLHSDRISQIGLLDSLASEAERLKRIKTLEVNYSCSVRNNYFDGQTNTFIFRIVQEILQNILKHAKASRVDIKVYDKDFAFFVIKIADNGIGFDTKEGNLQNKSSGIGLTNMFNRAKLIKADVEIDSEIGKGTTVSLILPIPVEENS